MRKTRAVPNLGAKPYCAGLLCYKWSFPFFLFQKVIFPDLTGTITICCILLIQQTFLKTWNKLILHGVGEHLEYTALSNAASLVAVLLLQTRGCWSCWELLMAQQVSSACTYLQCFVMVVVNPPALKSSGNVHWQMANTNSKCQWEDGVLAQSS